MSAITKTGLIVLTTLVAGYLIYWSVDSFGPNSLLAALLVNWVAMSWMAVIGQWFRPAFPAGYYTAQPIERNGEVYEALGIKLFKKLVRRGPLAVFSPTLRIPAEKTISALEHLWEEMSKAETGHVLVFGLVCLFEGYALFRSWLEGAGWLMLCNLLINGYPVLLQRDNRIKLGELMQASRQTAG